MKRFGLIAMLVGLAVLIGLVVHQGAREIAGIFLAAGWSLLWLAPLHLVPLTLDARGWQTLLKPSATRLSYLSWVAAVREAVNRLLPAANIGGEVVGIRLAAMVVSEPGVAAASVVVEVLLTMVAQYLLCAAGVVATLLLVARVPQATSVVIALLLSLPVPLGLAWVLRHGAIFSRIERAAKRLVGDGHALAGFDGLRLDDALHRLLHRYATLARAFAWQLAGMLVGCAETWLALWLLGHPVGIGAALAIESFSLAIRSVVFFVPGGLGVQEAGTIVLAQLFGISPDMGLSLALVRRMRELVVGVPALLSWQLFEARRLSHAPQVHPSR